jgi:hypothetical protein
MRLLVSFKVLIPLFVFKGRNNAAKTREEAVRPGYSAESALGPLRNKKGGHGEAQ